MNLEERRDTAAAQESTLTPLAARLAETLKQPLDLEVNWESFSGQAEAFRKFLKFLPDVEKVLAGIASDAIGLEALQAKLKKITFEQVKDKGVLTDTAKIAETTLSFHWDWSRMYIDPARLSKHLSKQL